MHALVLAALLSGIVVDSSHHPISGAAVSIDSFAPQSTDNEGRFRFDLPPGVYTLRVTQNGFQAQSVRATSGEELTVTLHPLLEENIVVSGIRAEAETPVTKTDLTRADIERDYYGQDIPMLLRETPSVTAYAEGGVGASGYSYVSLRGISSSRINFTLDGVPLADSEDMSTYFVDFPDLAHSLESIQVQRGVGTSTVGAGAFGGSINLESVALSSTSQTDAWIGGGSFGTKLANAGYQTGLLPGGFEAYGRISAQETDGYREHSGTRGANFFFSGAKTADDWQLKLTGFAAHEWQQNSYFAADAGTLQTDLRANPMSPDERDSFGYNLAQVEYLRENMTASVFFQRGYGWYRLYDDDVALINLRQYGLDGLLVGSMITYSTPHAQYGLHVNDFRREHTRDLVGGPRDYFNYGTKSEINGFAKFTWDTDGWHFYSDNQLRTTDFSYHGDQPIGSIRWTFFNPKLGVRYGNWYASAGMSRREPARNDLFAGEDDPSVVYDLHAVKPERVLDFEAGWEKSTARGSVSADIYVMNFHNEIAATGELSDIGLPLRRNVDRSYRRGLELHASYQLTRDLQLLGSASFSRNRIHSWTQYDDSGGNPVTYFDVNPLLTPSVILTPQIAYTPASRVSFGAVGRYVGKSYLDNTNDDALVTPPFFVVDATASYRLMPRAKLMLQINNLLDRKHVYPSGYASDGVSYFYPLASRNAVLTLHFTM
ncbi:MAG TPA: TonB-dependent receptor [Thermoanaerobaculia bacterium]|nr:TonB-dependent receptor [Thermoanaerobaculia bacterium]